MGLLIQHILTHCNMDLKTGLETTSLIISTDKYRRRWSKGRERKGGREGPWNLLGKSFSP